MTTHYCICFFLYVLKQYFVKIKQLEKTCLFHFLFKNKPTKKNLTTLNFQHQALHLKLRAGGGVKMAEE